MAGVFACGAGSFVGGCRMAPTLIFDFGIVSDDNLDCCKSLHIRVIGLISYYSWSNAARRQQQVAKVIVK